MKRIPLALASLMAVAALPAVGADAKGAGGPLRDGNWAGTMAIGATISFGGDAAALVAQASGNGTFNLALAGGTAAGDYVLGGSSSATVEAPGTSGEANAVVAIAGTLQGTAAAPILQPAQGHADVTGSVTVNGFEAPIDVSLDFAADEMVASTMVITSSSCTYASGTWAQELESAVQAAGAAVTSFQGSWAAVFKGATPGATDAALTDILDRGEAILTSWFATGTFDAEALEDVLVDAEHFAAAGPKNDACATGKPADWSSPLSGLMDRILLAMANSTSTTAEDLRFGVAAGLRTGVLPSVDSPLEGELQIKAEALLEQAIAGGSTTDITLVAISATSMGWTDLAAEATAALGGGQ